MEQSVIFLFASILNFLFRKLSLNYFLECCLNKAALAAVFIIDTPVSCKSDPYEARDSGLQRDWNKSVASAIPAY